MNCYKILRYFLFYLDISMFTFTSVYVTMSMADYQYNRNLHFCATKAGWVKLNKI